MRKAISFFIFAILIFVLIHLITSSIGLSSTIFSVAVAVFAGLNFIAYPRKSADFYSFFPKSPFYFIEFIVIAILRLGVFLILILLIGLPLLIGYLIISYIAAYTTVFWAIFLILIVSVFIGFKNTFIDFVNKIILIRDELSENASTPFKKIYKNIDVFFDEICEWVETKD